MIRLRSRSLLNLPFRQKVWVFDTRLLCLTFALMICFIPAVANDCFPMCMVSLALGDRIFG